MEAANIMLLHAAGQATAAERLPQIPSREENPGEGTKNFEEIFYREISAEPAKEKQPEELPTAVEAPARVKEPGNADTPAENSTRVEDPKKRGSAEGQSEIKEGSDKNGSNLRILNGKNKKEINPKSFIQGRDTSGQAKRGETVSADKKTGRKKPETAGTLNADLSLEISGKTDSAAESAEIGEIAGQVHIKDITGITDITREGPNKVTMTLQLQEQRAGEKAVAQGAAGLFPRVDTRGNGPQVKNKDTKKFVLIDKRSGRDGSENQGKEQTVKNTGKGILRFAVKENTGSAAQSESGEFKIVKEEVPDSSEKMIKLNTESAGVQADKQPETQAAKQANSAQLTRHLAEQGNKQIVKQTGIILKDNGSGEIRLILKPESMGNVRIQLQLQDNSITGKILVDNSAVKYAFDQNMDELYEAFKESGFENASLDVQVGGREQGGKKNGNSDGTGPALHKIEKMEEQIPLIREDNSADTLIDLVV